MKVKQSTFLIIFFLFSIIHNSNGQQATDYPEYVSGLLKWFSNLDDILLRITDKEKLKRMNRQLSYMDEDMNEMVVQKELLTFQMNELLKKTKEIENNANWRNNIIAIVKVEKMPIEESIKKIKSGLNNFNERLKLIKQDLAQSDQEDVEDIITEWQYSLTLKWVDVGRIERLFEEFGRNEVNMKEIIKSQVAATETKNIAKKLSKEIRKAKKKIRNAMER